MSTRAGDSLRPSSVTYKSIVAYDGTDFEGFQRQKEPLRTIQAELESALASLGWQDSSILAAGRTDKGVHAQGQVIAFQLAWGHEPDDLTRALNALLPEDIAIRGSEEIADDFHPRFDAKSRVYRYSFFMDPIRQPLIERYALRLKTEPDLAQMEAAAALLIGERDYRVFGPAPRPEGTTVRTISRAQWSSHDRSLTFEIEANAFLKHMVRRIVAVMLEIGAGRLTISEYEKLLDTSGERWEGGLAPPQGLSLEYVHY